MIKNSCNGTNEQFKKRKIIIVGGSLLNGIHEKGLSKNHSVNGNNILGGTSEAILYKLDDFLRNKSDGLIVHAGITTLAREKIYWITLKNLKASKETFPEY